MNQMGGHAIYYDMSTSPLNSGKESIADTVRTTCRYVDIIMARLYKHEDLLEMARYTTVLLINALTNYSHPGQVLADFRPSKNTREVSPASSWPISATASTT